MSQWHQRSTSCSTYVEVPTREDELLLSSPHDSDSHKANDQWPPSYGKNVTANLGSSLPPGWNRLYDPDGKEYFMNSITHVTQWEHPEVGPIPDHADAKIHPPRHDSIIPDANPFSSVAITVHEHNQSVDHTSEFPQFSQMRGERGLTYDLNQNILATSHLLTTEQLDDVPYRSISLDKYDKKSTCGQAVCHTLRENIALTILSLLIWCLIIIFTTSLIVTRNPATFAALGGAGFFYLSYCIILLNIGVCPPQGGYKEPIFPPEKVMQKLRANAVDTPNTIVNTIEGMVRTDPHLEILMDCYHSGYLTGRAVDAEGKQSVKGIMTYQMKRRIPIIRYKDISVRPTIIGDMLSQCPSDTIHLTYNYTYELHPTQVSVLEGCIKQLYYDNLWRDKNIDITVKYCVPGYEDHHANMLVKASNRSQRAWRALCLHRCGCWAMACSSLYLIYLMFWHRCTRTVEYENVKYLHIGLPNPKDDEIVYSVPYNERRLQFPKYDEELLTKNNPQLVNRLSRV